VPLTPDMLVRAVARRAEVRPLDHTMRVEKPHDAGGEAATPWPREEARSSPRAPLAFERIADIPPTIRLASSRRLGSPRTASLARDAVAFGPQMRASVRQTEAD
jgi:hypothetical protein